jgi:hypothetical protein
VTAEAVVTATAMAADVIAGSFAVT